MKIFSQIIKNPIKIFEKNLNKFYYINMRYMMKISYNGKNYCGWQKQNNKKTIEGVIEETMMSILGCEIDIVASGRTDSDVSAICQVAHFDVGGVIPRGFMGHINSVLPNDIRINSIELAKESFHARFNAKMKTYKYYFYVGVANNAYYDLYAQHVKYQLDDSAMQKAIKSLNGEHDFTSFCNVDTDVKDKIRKIKNISLKRTGDMYEFSITGNGFLYNMVRIIVGTLVDIGRGKITLSVEEILNKHDRKYAGVTMPAKGLVLFNVEY